VARQLTRNKQLTLLNILAVSGCRASLLLSLYSLNLVTWLVPSKQEGKGTVTGSKTYSMVLYNSVPRVKTRRAS